MKCLQKNGMVRQVYECCQTEASSNNHKKPWMEPETGKKVWDVCRMPHFNCNGLLYMTLQNRYFDCLLKHQLDHILYKDIGIPDEWCQYITDNHKYGPTKVRVPCFIESVMLNKLSRSGTRFFSELGVEKGSHSLKNLSITIGYAKVPNSGSALTT